MVVRYHSIQTLDYNPFGNLIEGPDPNLVLDT
jgi:hypothetical protein